MFLNQDEHAYLKVRFDPQSIDWFTENLHTIGDSLTRAVIHRYFWMLVTDRKMSSIKYMDFVEKQLPNEGVEQTVVECLMNLRVCVARFIPTELTRDKKNMLFDTLVTLLAKEGSPKDSIVDNLFGFLASAENMRTALGWLE